VNLHFKFPLFDWNGCRSGWHNRGTGIASCSSLGAEDGQMIEDHAVCDAREVRVGRANIVLCVAGS
jgi:hypothetical protein